MLKKGDEIVTIGGMFGVIRRIGDDWVEIEVSRGTRVRFLKRAVSSIVSEEEEDEEEEYEEYAAEEIEAADEEAVEDEEEPLVEGEAALVDAAEAETDRPA